MTWPEPGSGISANLAESLISIKVKNVARPGLASEDRVKSGKPLPPHLILMAAHCVLYLQQGRGPKGQVAPIPPNPPTRIHCTNGNYAYLTEAVLWGQSQLKTLFHRYGDQADARARREDVTISGSDAECEGPWRSCMYFLVLDDVLEIKGS